LDNFKSFEYLFRRKRFIYQYFKELYILSLGR
jgi:hypothetical protein